MECIYLPEYNEYLSNYKVNVTESAHLRALRIKNGQEILVSDGKGNLFECLVNSKSRVDYYLNCFNKMNYPKKQIIDIAFGVLKNKDRLEFAIEKAVEQGINKIILLETDYTEIQKINYQRLDSKIISALKQSKNPNKTELTALTGLNSIDFSYYKTIVIADENGLNFRKLSIISPVLIIVGPEGGFSESESEMLNNLENIAKLKLSTLRLRTETAVTSSISLVLNLI